jgi:Domain of unknown function (DUF6265)
MKTILLLMLITISINPQGDSINKLFPGKWKLDSDKAEIYEEWKMIDSTELIGTGYSIEAGEKIGSETIYLKKFADTWAYVAIPKNQTITLFALKEFTLNKFIFENGEHDFPQRIIYEFNNDGTLTAIVGGLLEGEEMSREFNFIKVDK